MRLLVLLFKTIHHFLQFGGFGKAIWPWAFANKYQELSGFVHPVGSSQSPLFKRGLDMLSQMFLWQTTHLTRAHYIWQMRELAQKIKHSGYTLAEIQTFLPAAIQQTKNKLGQKLKPGTIQFLNKIPRLCLLPGSVLQNFHNGFHNIRGSQPSFQAQPLTTHGSHAHTTHKHTNSRQQPLPHTHKHPPPLMSIQTHKHPGFQRPKNTSKQPAQVGPQPLPTHNRFEALHPNTKQTPVQQKNQTSNTQHNKSPQTPAGPQQKNKGAPVFIHTPQAPKPQRLQSRTKHSRRTNTQNPAPARGTYPQSPIPPLLTPNKQPNAQTHTKQAPKKPNAQTPLMSRSPVRLSQESGPSTYPLAYTHSLKHQQLCDPNVPPTNVQGQGDVLSNFHPCTFTYQGRTYHSAEQCYQHIKAEFVGADELAASIISTPAHNSGTIKLLGNRVKNDFAPQMGKWDSGKLLQMEGIIFQRAKQSVQFRNHLLNTYPSPLVHRVPDHFWGTNEPTSFQVKNPKFMASFYSKRQLKGKDHFAKILMRVRFHFAVETGLVVPDCPELSNTSHTPQPIFIPHRFRRTRVISSYSGPITTPHTSEATPDLDPEPLPHNTTTSPAQVQANRTQTSHTNTQQQDIQQPAQITPPQNPDQQDPDIHNVHTHSGESRSSSPEVTFLYSTPAQVQANRTQNSQQQDNQQPAQITPSQNPDQQNPDIHSGESRSSSPEIPFMHSGAKHSQIWASTAPTQPHTHLETANPDQSAPSSQPIISPATSDYSIHSDIFPALGQLYSSPTLQPPSPSRISESGSITPHPATPPPLDWSKQASPNLYTPPTRPRLSRRLNSHTSSRPILGPNLVRHNNVKAKWSIPATKAKLLVIGDSNIKRINSAPPGINSIQLHSFAGAKFSHIKDIFSRSPDPEEQPSHVILSVGINNRDTPSEANLTVDIRKTLHAFARQYPDSSRSICLLNGSSRLTPGQINRIKFINQTIELKALNYNTQVIPALPDRHFSIDPSDGHHIHWSANTANRLLSHWNEHLN